MQESSLDWSEVEEALAVVRERKTKGLVSSPIVNYSSSDQKELLDLRVWHADTANELEKTRKLLQMQHTINKDYKKEVSMHSMQISH